MVLALGITLAGRAPVAGASAGRHPATFDPRAVYLRDCATCHGSEGQGTPKAPQIATAGGALTDYELTTGRMPLDDPDQPVRRHKPRYSSGGISSLVDYISSLGGDGVPVPTIDLAGADVPRGGELYRLNCAACHSWSGTGGALLGREAPPLSHSTPVQVAEAVRTGPGSMPSFGRESLSDDDVDAVAAYVREIQHPNDRGGNGLLHLGPFPEGAVAWLVGIGTMLLFVNWVGEREPKG
ncbi:MAG: ubiquinol-cytochrome c reductase cytochrome c subunit [Actinomycetota bacterium]|nr:ubiquinol-cytochrome c reductase cytochrome c subunit [Actinomycetota bacterium]